MERFFTNQVNGILATISLHLMVVIVFLWFKLGEVREDQKAPVMIEFNEEILQPEERQEQQEEEAGAAEGDMPALSAREVHNIASNVASKLDEEISTRKYEQQVMQELGISSLKNPAAPETAEPAPDENAIGQPAGEDQSPDEPYVPNVLRKENTTVSYFLENRWHRYIYIPTYKCEGGGTVILDIVINPSGRVISAVIAENKSTRDDCLRQEAYRSATTAQFNPDPNSPAKQLGTITYVFLAQ